MWLRKKERMDGYRIENSWIFNIFVEKVLYDRDVY